MSYKYQAYPVSANHYVLEKTGAMNCDVHAFLNEHLYEISEENLWNQAVNGASYPGVIAVYLQADTHSGFGVPIGCVIVTDDVIIQAGSGYDVSCGILMQKTNLHASDIVDIDVRQKFITEVEKRVAMGVGSNRPAFMKSFHPNKLEEILRYGAKAIGVHSDICERQYIPISDKFDSSKVEKAIEKALPQLGSIGGGNHYTEVQCDPVDGSVWIQIHCGCRGFGWQNMNHFFYAGAELRGLPTNRREDSWLRIDEPLGKEYWDYHNASANYAIANRHIIAAGINEALKEVFNHAESEVYYEISHNLVQRETLILPDGTTKQGFVHRKGATRAFPAKHPDLIGTKWEDTGHPALIPGSMFLGSAILFAQENAHISGYSVNHGSGRVMGRGEAKRQLADKQEDLNSEMQNIVRTFNGVDVKGIAYNTNDVLADESNGCYKDLDEVLSVLTAEGIAKVDRRLYPVANLKGAD